jgi:hypothetical protein
MKKNYLLICSLLLLIFCTKSQGQAITQTIRGTVIEHETNAPLYGVNVAVFLGDKLLNGSQTDEAGYFKIEKIPVGRVNVNTSYLGYQKIVMNNVVVTAGKEVVLRLEMNQAINEIKEVQVSGGKRKGETINEMATISARAFTIEETSRYAGSRDDPARMASNFAGVSGTDDSRNDIVIRGNSPFGVQWRLENINIPSPSHFAISGTTGGPVSMLNNKLLANSDFFTGAFPAEYGNALAGVFDLRIKKGNDEHHEGAIQFGLFGAEAFAEGPLSKKTKASYVFDFRYSTLELLQKIGIDIGTKAIPHYQDLNFNLNFPLKKGGNVNVFGIGGYSTVDLVSSTDKKPAEREIYSSNNTDEFLKTGTGIIGVNYTHPINEKCYSKISIAASVQSLKNHFIRIKRHVDGTSGEYVVDGKYDQMFFHFIESKFSANFYRNYKLNARHVIRFGMNSELLRYNYSDSILNETTWLWEKRLQYKGTHFLFQSFVQWKFNASEKLLVTAGLHGQLFTLNNSWSIEPRASLKYQFKKNQSFALGVGLHSQMQPNYIYFQKDNLTDPYNTNLRNKHLDFTRAFHAVGSYDIFFKGDVRIKVEAYYQYLFGIPVDTFASSYCILNEGSSFDRFFPNRLTNKGVGRNFGLELTVEKFFTHNWFIMFTGSLYDARYKASNGKWYNSDFNGQYVMNALGTKEFKWGKKRINTIGIGGKITFGGGQRYTPFDTLRSTASDPVVVDAERNKYQFKPYFRFDIKINYSFNSKRHVTHEVGIDLVNITFQKNILRLQYVQGQAQPKEVYQLGFLPIFYYRCDFSFEKRKRG